MNSQELLDAYDRNIAELRKEIDEAVAELDEEIELSRMVRKWTSGEWSKQRLKAELNARFWKHQDEKQYERAYQVDCLLDELEEKKNA